jgi:hypothetical protein
MIESNNEILLFFEKVNEIVKKIIEKLNFTRL